MTFPWNRKKTIAAYLVRYYRIGDLLLTYMSLNHGMAMPDGYYGLFQDNNIAEWDFQLAIRWMKDEGLISLWSKSEDDRLMLTIKGEQAAKIGMNKFYSQK